jgi:hypothetical protein
MATGFSRMTRAPEKPAISRMGIMPPCMSVAHIHYIYNMIYCDYDIYWEI